MNREYILRRTLSEYHFDNNKHFPISGKLKRAIVIGARRPLNGDMALIYVRTIDTDAGTLVEAHVEALDPFEKVPLQETFCDPVTLEEYCKERYLKDPRKVYQV